MRRPISARFRPDQHGTPRSPQERSAALVEYTLILAVFVMVSVGVVGEMNDNADDFFEDSSDHIGAPINSFEYDEDGNRPGANTLASTTTITAPPTTSTTTVPPTTAAPTTTVAPTTTAPAPTTTFATTTTTQASSMSTVLEDRSRRHPTSYNKWRAIVKVTVIATPGVNVSGVSVSAVLARPNNTTITRACTTNGDGVCYMEKSSVSGNLDYWDVEITSVSGSVPWTGTENEIRLENPL